MEQRNTMEQTNTRHRILQFQSLQKSLISVCKNYKLGSAALGYVGLLGSSGKSFHEKIADLVITEINNKKIQISELSVSTDRSTVDRNAVVLIALVCALQDYLKFENSRRFINGLNDFIHDNNMATIIDQVKKISKLTIDDSNGISEGIINTLIDKFNNLTAEEKSTLQNQLECFFIYPKLESSYLCLKQVANDKNSPLSHLFIRDIREKIINTLSDTLQPPIKQENSSSCSLK